MSLRLSLFIIVALLTGAVAFAEEPKRGTLPDGRAFRTDPDGNQLVDYIAELEVNIESLEQRIYGLEDELKDKDNAIERYKRGQPQNVTIQEREISPGRPAVSKASQVTCPSCPKCIDREGEISALYDDLSRVRDNLDLEKQRRNDEARSYQESLKKLEAPGKECSVQLSKANAALAEARGKREALQDELRSVNARYDIDLKEKEGKIRALEAEIETAKVQLATAKKDAQEQVSSLRASVVKLQALVKSQETQLASSAVELDRAKKAGEAVVVERASYRAPRPLEPIRKGSEYSGMSSAKERAISDLRGELSLGVERVRKSAGQRDNLFAKFDQKGRAVQIKPGKLVSSRGLSLDVIEKQLDSAYSVRELAPMKRDIKEIERLVADDIALVQRLQKSHS